MKKTIMILALVLCCILLVTGCGCRHEWLAATCTTPKTCELCGVTEGEAKGHIWEDATCIVPKKCAVCHLTEGKALSHNWAEATTDEPKTCLNCKETEGTKLQTDPRFTTAATKQLHGVWSCEVELTGEMLGMPPGYFESVPCTLLYEFGNTGEMTGTVELHDYFAFIDEIKRMTTEVMYESLSAQGISKDDADKAMQSTYGMTMSEFIEAYIAEIDLDELFAMFSADGVYYVGQNGLYTSDSWYGEFGCSAFTLEDGVLIIEDMALEEGEEPLHWTRVED